MSHARTALAAILAIGLLLIVTQVLASEPSDREVTVSESDVALECSPGHIQTATVSTYAPGIKGQGTPTDELQEYLQTNGFSGVPSDAFDELGTDEEGAPVVAVHGNTGRVDVVFMTGDGDGGWHVDKVNACYEFEQKARADTP
jgi:hypothetical protein